MSNLFANHGRAMRLNFRAAPAVANADLVPEGKAGGGFEAPRTAALAAAMQ
jgi:hypothetical protein